MHQNIRGKKFCMVSALAKFKQQKKKSIVVYIAVEDRDTVVGLQDKDNLHLVDMDKVEADLGNQELKYLEIQTL